MTPRLRMPAFSPAMAARVSPSLSWWSSETGVMTQSAGRGMTLVASSRPPRPTSRISGVGWMLGEGQEGGSGRDLEIGDVIAGVGGAGCARARRRARPRRWGAPCRRRRRARCARGSARDAARCRRARACPRPRSMALRKARRRALAVGAGDVDDGRQALLRVAELVEQPLDAAERKVDQLGMQRPQLGQQSVTRAHGAPIAHRHGKTKARLRSRHPAPSCPAGGEERLLRRGLTAFAPVRLAPG